MKFYLVMVIISIYVCIQESTKFSPFKAMFGRAARLPVDINSSNDDPEARLMKYEEIKGNDELMLNEREHMK